MSVLTAVKEIILSVPPCPDGGFPVTGCASCLATAISDALLNPERTPLATYTDRLPMFSMEDVNEIVDNALKIQTIIDRAYRA